jgi:hypothetical protein
MDYLQLKYSVEKLTECLKVLPKKDRGYLRELLLMYKEQLKSIDYINESNAFFDKKEIRHINQFISCLKERVLKPYIDEINDIEEKICISSGLREFNKKLDLMYNKISRIAEYYHQRECLSYIGLSRKIKEKSQVYKKMWKEYNLIADVYDVLLEKSNEYQNALKKHQQIEKLINSFDIDLPLKNLIAYRSRNMKEKQSSIDIVIRESISNEINKQWFEFNQKNK